MMMQKIPVNHNNEKPASERENLEILRNKQSRREEYFKGPAGEWPAIPKDIVGMFVARLKNDSAAKSAYDEYLAKHPLPSVGSKNDYGLCQHIFNIFSLQTMENGATILTTEKKIRLDDGINTAKLQRAIESLKLMGCGGVLENQTNERKDTFWYSYTPAGSGKLAMEKISFQYRLQKPNSNTQTALDNLSKVLAANAKTKS